MRDVLFAGGSDSPHNKVMRGQITLSQVSGEDGEGSIGCPYMEWKGRGS